MTGFKSADYGSAFAVLIDPNRPVAIDAGSANTSLQATLENTDIENAFASPITSIDFASSCLSAAWLWNDFLDESHTISQDIHTSTGSFWHAIMHRRECDYSNSKYWFRKVGKHDVFVPLAEQAVDLAGGTDRFGLLDQGGWDPFAFVDLCQQAGNGDPSLLDYCREITRVEWELLFDYCYQRAVGS